MRATRLPLPATLGQILTQIDQHRASHANIGPHRPKCKYPNPTSIAGHLPNLANLCKPMADIDQRLVDNGQVWANIGPNCTSIGPHRLDLASGTTFGQDSDTFASRRVCQGVIVWDESRATFLHLVVGLQCRWRFDALLGHVRRRSRSFAEMLPNRANMSNDSVGHFLRWTFCQEIDCGWKSERNFIHRRCASRGMHRRGRSSKNARGTTRPAPARPTHAQVGSVIVEATRADDRGERVVQHGARPGVHDHGNHTREG